MVLSLTLLYLALAAAPMRDILWHDELFTFYIAQSPSISSFLDIVRTWDWQPPLVFATAWLAQQIFGVNEFATRLPSLLAFYGGSMAVFFALKRRVGVLWAATPLLLFWFSFYFRYATEARPYGLMTGFFGLSLYSYLRATEEGSSPHRSLWLLGLLAGGAGMMLSHMLAPFSMMAFGIAELVRTVERRKIDWALWFVIVAPLGIATGYFSKMQNYQQNYFPQRFQASPQKIPTFYAKAVRYVLPSILLGIITAFVAGRFRRTHATQKQPAISKSQIALLLGMLLPPILVIAIIMRSAGAFWERYCITSAVAVYIVCGLGLAWLGNWQRRAGLTVVAILLVTGLVRTTSDYQGHAPLHLLEPVHPELPLVDTSGLAFLEMDHYERPPLLKRLFYLTDREAAIHYAHATLFENFGALKKDFPIRANVMPYIDFIRQNKHFLVFGPPQYPEDWLLNKLKDDGASIQQLKPVRTPYSPFKDGQLFEVTVP